MAFSLFLHNIYISRGVCGPFQDLSPKIQFLSVCRRQIAISPFAVSILRETHRMLLVYVEYINTKLIWRFTAKDWSLEMYNEKIHKPETFQRGTVQKGGTLGNPRAQMRDIPDTDRLDAMPSRPDRMQPRRRCDGSLVGFPIGEQSLGAQRNSGGAQQRPEERPCPSDCARGACGGWGIEARPLAMVYSPCQAWRDAYSPEVALSRGTLFSELDLPFEASKCKRGCM